MAVGLMGLVIGVLIGAGLVYAYYEPKLVAAKRETKRVLREQNPPRNG